MTEDDIEVIPITRRAEVAMAMQALSKVQRLLDEAKQVNDDLALLLAEDNGAAMGPGDQARFAQDEEGNISLLLLRGGANSGENDESGDHDSGGGEPGSGPLGDGLGLRDGADQSVHVEEPLQEGSDVGQRHEDVGASEAEDQG